MFMFMYTVGLLMILHSVPLYITVTLKIINIKGTKISGFFSYYMKCFIFMYTSPP